MVSTASFKGLYFTKHALERAKERGLSVSDIWSVWHNPQGSKKASTKGAFIYWRNHQGKRIEVVAKKEEGSRWVIISVWVRRIASFQKESFLDFLIRKLLLYKLTINRGR